jgi:hypothetical protein
VDNVYHHLWIFGDSPVQTCRCGMVTQTREMTWTPISTFGQNSLPAKSNFRAPERPNLDNSGDISFLLDLAAPKINSIMAALENAETLSSIGTVIHVL